MFFEVTPLNLTVYNNSFKQTMAHLQGGKVDISLIQTSARNNLINLLEKCPGKKAIVWDNNLAGPVGLVAQYTILREHMVTKMYPLRPTALPETDVDHVIFISRPKLHLMDFIGNYPQNVYLHINDIDFIHSSECAYGY